MKYLISLLIILGSCASALADSRHTTVATVPFDFVVGKQTFPAGTYVISQISDNGSDILRVQSKDGRVTGFTVPVAIDLTPDTASARMVFQHTGETYLLTTIVSDDRTYTLTRYSGTARMPDPAATVVTSMGP